MFIFCLKKKGELLPGADPRLVIDKTDTRFNEKMIVNSYFYYIEETLKNSGKKEIPNKSYDKIILLKNDWEDSGINQVY